MRTLPLTALALLALACGTGRPPRPAPPAPAPDPAPAGTAPARCYTAAPLSPQQVKVECANGQSFVVRQGADGKWREEAKSVAGSRPAFASLDEAGRLRCGCP